MARRPSSTPAMFSYAESIATRNTVLSSLREAAAEMNKNKPAITFTINGESEDPNYVYTTSDRIEGEVSITAPVDTRFDEIVITFEGTTRTWMERFGGPGTSGRSTLYQTVSDLGGANPKQKAVEKIPFLTEAQFLRLVQPVDESSLPIPRIAAKGQKYTFPFTFVIPDRLLPSACDHPVENNAVREAHLHLPPSLGEPGILGKDCKDDQSPDMTRIGYAIRCRIMRRRESDAKNVVLADTTRKIAVSPVFETSPPLHITDKTKDFCVRREKDLRKGLLGRKLGRISVFAEQPQPLKLSPNSPCPPSTSVTILLTWLSSDSSTPPPPLECLTAKLKTSTFFSTTRQTYIPCFSRSTPDPAVGNYTELNLLSSRCISNTPWEKQPSDFPTSRSVYITKLLVPITAPKGKHLVPTFSSCFVSRSYTLELSVSARTSAHTQPSLLLKIPLQVAQPGKEGDYSGDNGQSGDVEEFFTPRSVAPPAFEGIQTGQLPRSMIGTPNRMSPPGYSVFAQGVPVRIPSPVGMSPGCG